MCGGINHGRPNPVSVLLLRDPQGEAHPAQPTQSAPPASAGHPGETGAPSRKRRKLWELRRQLHCPVIGTCLDIDAWRRIARTQGVAVEAMTDYAVHLHLVASSEHRNALSRAAQKALERTHGGLVRRFTRARSRDQLESLWQQTLHEGDVPGGFWALVTHPLCDTRLTHSAYEEIHMLSHQIGAGQRADLRKLQDARSEIQRLRQELDAQQHRHRQAIDNRDRRLRQLQAQVATAQEEGRLAKAREAGAIQRLKSLGGTRLQERVTAYARRARAADQRAERLRAEVKDWRDACDLANRRANALAREAHEQSAQRQALERLLNPGANACDGCSASGPPGCPNLCGRRILCVGGRSQVIEHYRELVARCNGEFEHHDGGIEDKPQRLNSLLSSADVVICTIDCVSHDAYNRSKRFCKRYAKPCVLLRSSGVSTFARALEQVADTNSGKQGERERRPPGTIPSVAMLEVPG